MNTCILLDAGPLGMLANPKGSETTQACKAWLQDLLQKGARVSIPEIADYEVRRELLRANPSATLRAGMRTSVQRLDILKQSLEYVPLTTPMMLKAAELWAQMRQQGQPTADNKSLDADVILAAQASILCQSGEQVIVATTNVGHLNRMATAFRWQDII